MGIDRIAQGGAPAFGVRAAGSAAGKSVGSFQEQLGGQYKEQFRSRAAALFDEIIREAGGLLDHPDMSKFERYRSMIRNLLADVLRHAYVLQTEHVTDARGARRLYATVGIVDEKLEDMAKQLLCRTADKLRYLSRIDEIRGLVMDLFL